MNSENQDTNDVGESTGNAGFQPAQEKDAGKMPAFPVTAFPESKEGRWHSRGYLPHFDRAGKIQSITFRLHDSVPAKIVARWKEELQWRQELPASHPACIELAKKIKKYEDAGHGECLLEIDAICTLVENALQYFEGDRYHLITWCIMPNHVHVLLETHETYDVCDVVHSWKSFTANAANRLLKREGIFWSAEYHDRFIRDGEHLKNAIHYIETNRQKAGLNKKFTGDAGSTGNTGFQPA